MTKYQKYQLEWMISHGYSLENLVDELVAMQYIDSDELQKPVNELFREWEADRGFGSEIWACEKEWQEAGEM